jgi:nucleotide-binding universal stress UspA family protein
MGRIVVGLDGSPQSQLALQWALRQARCLDAEVLGVHVFAYTLPDVPDSDVAHPETIQDVIANAQRRATAVVQDALASAGALAEGVQFSSMVIPGREAPEHLLEQAAGADLLVLGSRGLGGFKKLLLGSVSQKCVDHAPCTVLVVRGPVPEHGGAARP